MRTETITPERLPQVLSEETQKRFWNKMIQLGPDDCWIWTAGLNVDGYGIFHIRFGEKLVQCRAPKVAWVSANKSVVPDGKMILHSCKQQRRCCNPNHLRPGTQLDNINDQIEQGTFAYVTVGEGSRYRKLNNAKVIEIRAKYASGKYSIRKLAKIENLNHCWLWKILTRKVWSHI